MMSYWVFVIVIGGPHGSNEECVTPIIRNKGRF